MKPEPGAVASAVSADARFILAERVAVAGPSQGLCTIPVGWGQPTLQHWTQVRLAAILRPMDSRKFKGTPPRLDVVFFRFPLYFITFNSLMRVRLLDNSAIQEAFEIYARRGVELGAPAGYYLLMPDHVHLFVRISEQMQLSQWMKGLKRHFDKVLLQQGHRPPQVPNSNLQSFWQPGFFDNVLRSDESYRKKWIYVSENPVRAGLVSRAEDWPYQGEIVRIDRA